MVKYVTYSSSVTGEDIRLRSTNSSPMAGMARSSSSGYNVSLLQTSLMSLKTLFDSMAASMSHGLNMSPFNRAFGSRSKLVISTVHVGSSYSVSLVARLRLAALQVGICTYMS